MDLNLQMQAVHIYDTVFDGVVEQPLECDVLLPDYCPDIQKILRCEVELALLSCAAVGEKLSVDGLATAQLYYLSEDGCIRHTCYKIPYHKSVELRTAPENPVIRLSQSVEYFHCRAVSPRRLDMRGAASIRIRVSQQQEEQTICGAENAGLQLRREAMETAFLLPQAMRQFSVREDLELGYGKPAAGAVIRCSGSVQNMDYKVISGKIITKGELALHLLYQCEEDPQKLEIMEYMLPLNQVIDLEGVDEDCVCSVWYDVCTVEVEPKRGEDGESRIFGVTATINACAQAVRKMQLDTCSDGYSTQYECKPEQKQLAFLRLAETVNEGMMYKETIPLPPGMKEVIDLWCVAGPPQVRMEEEEAVVSGKLTICMLAYDENHAIAYYDQAKEYRQAVALHNRCTDLQFAPVVQIDSTAFILSGADQMEVRCGLRIQGGLFESCRKRVLTDVAVDESRPKSRQENVLYLYYACEQEPVWEIAKRYNTSVEAIREENQLEGDALCGKRMLLIPMR